MEILRKLPPRELVPGITAHYQHGNAMTLGLVLIKAGTSMGEHKHPHEQITYMISGEMRMMIGDELVILKAGAVQVIPSNIMHGAFAITDCELIDVFTPVREDYR